MGLFSKLSGVINSFFQIGGPAGPGLNNVSTTVISATTSSGGTNYANVRGATPLVDADFATKAYVDESFKPMPVTAQSNAASSLVANTSTEHYIVVSTAGTGSAAAYVAGAVLWDDGSNTGNVAVIAPVTGGTIIVTTALTGGTFTFTANQQYVWTGATWSNISPTVSGALYVIDFTIGTSSSQSSTSYIPANAIVLRADVTITSAYSGGATISVGQTGSTSLLLGTGDNIPQTIDEYQSSARVAWGSTQYQVLVTVGGSPSVGAGVVTIQYVQALS
jgi:hypothetical protein